MDSGLHDESSRDPVAGKIAALNRDDGAWAGEVRFQKRDGQEFPARLSTALIGDRNGRPAGMVGIASDLTEQKRVEEAPKQTLRQKELYRTLVEEADDVIGVKDARGRYTLVNSEMVRRLGIPKENLIGKTASEVYPGETGSLIEQNDELVFKSGEPVETEDVVETTRGTMVVLTRKTPIKDDEGKPSRLLFVGRDITQRKRAEQGLRDSEERYRTLVEIAGDPITLKDREGRYVMVNSEFKRLLGVQAGEEIYGKTPSDLFPEAVGARLRKADLEALTAGATVETEAEVMTRTGPRTFLGRRVTVRDEDGGVTGLLGISRDITERKKAEEENRRLASAVATANEAVIIAEMEGRVSFVNRAAELMCGYTNSEMLGISVFDLQAESSEHPTAGDIIEATVTDGSWTGEVLFQKKTGEEFPVRLSTALMTDQEGRPTGMVGISADITERLELENLFLQAQKMEAVGQLAGGLAHDFSNLLTAIMSFTDLAIAKLPGTNDSGSYLSEVKKATWRAADITRQLMAFSHRQVASPRVVSLNDIVLDMNRMLRRLVSEDIELILVPAQDLRAVRTDPGQIEQALANLAINARDAMPKGGCLTIETENVTLDEEYASSHPDVTPGEYVMLTVADIGTGMTAEVKAHAFDPLFTTKEMGEGTGLGLSTCYGIVAQNGGHITIDSSPGWGTTVRIYLPSVEGPAAVLRPGDELGCSATGDETVLLAEDDPLVRRVTAETLRGRGYAVLEASNGIDALNMAGEYADKEIDLLLTDIVMPLMGAAEMVGRFNELHPEARVLYTSGYTQASDALGLASGPGADFLHKPFTTAALSEKVRELLDRSD